MLMKYLPNLSGVAYTDTYVISKCDLRVFSLLMAHAVPLMETKALSGENSLCNQCIPLKTQCVITSPSLIRFIPLTGLQDNPWVCDCRLSTLLDISKAPESSLVLLDQFLTCSEPPDLAGVPFQSVELTRCRRPYAVTSATKITALLGSNVLLRCDATGHPAPTIMWIKSARPNLYNQGIFLYTHVAYFLYTQVLLLLTNNKTFIILFNVYSNKDEINKNLSIR